MRSRAQLSFTLATCKDSELIRVLTEQLFYVILCNSFVIVTVCRSTGVHDIAQK